METSKGIRSSNSYIPSKGQSTKQGSSKLESMFENVLANQDKADRILKGLAEMVINLEPVGEEEEKKFDVPTIVGEVQTEIPIVKQRLTKKTEDAKCQRFYDQLKQLSMNIPFLDVVKEMPGFAKYLKDLLTMKRSVKNDTHEFARALCDNGARINLMPLAIYKQSNLGMPRPTTMRLQMADRSIKRPGGAVDNVPVRVGKFLLPADFVILDCDVDREIPIILGRPFLGTVRALMDSKKNEIKF
ncbi:uncharacterized protein LOC132042155 [Lycium ferocissimum]|uniref:uncharacterized protein LOC132042155 n=1 Tax=Lycium ferocissimum TaxID=112874 RepID=UPI002815E2FB|nr:uncharacterized protein LOC132042155 [Lycium ferocissimum]